MSSARTIGYLISLLISYIICFLLVEISNKNYNATRIVLVWSRNNYNAWKYVVVIVTIRVTLLFFFNCAFICLYFSMQSNKTKSTGQVSWIFFICRRFRGVQWFPNDQFMILYVNWKLNFVRLIRKRNIFKPSIFLVIWDIVDSPKSYLKLKKNRY